MLFKQADQDNDGVINEEEFRQLMVSMNVVVQNDENEDVNTLLRVIDPHNN